MVSSGQSKWIASTAMEATARVAAVVGTLVLLSGCASMPGEAFDELLQQHALEAATMMGMRFRHRYLYKAGRDGASGLRVYLEGDGRPWIRGRRIARDPTTREPLALRLMLRDPGNALYLARPCYHRLDGSPPCHPRLWTSARYGETVVDEMAAALRRLLGDAQDQQPVTLVGYSGGGVLGMLLARRVGRVDQVVTVAANLDTDAWADLHGYSPLADSLNPAVAPPLSDAIRQLHLAGDDDATVPPRLIEQALQSQSGATFAVMKGFDHRCCWESIWPTVIATLQAPPDICRQLARDVSVSRCGHVNGRGH